MILYFLDSGCTENVYRRNNKSTFYIVSAKESKIDEDKILYQLSNNFRVLQG